MKLTADAKLIVGGVVVAGFALWWFAKKGNAASVGAAMGGAAVDLAVGVLSGTYDASVGKIDKPINNFLDSNQAVNSFGQGVINIVDSLTNLWGVQGTAPSSAVPVPAYQLPTNFGVNGGGW